MIPVGQPYRPAGTLDVRSILITTILGVTAAVIGAALFWLWEWSPIPTLVVLTPIIQGTCVGAVMAFAVGRLRMRNPWLVGTVGFACGLLSITLVHYGHYITMVSTAADDLRGRIAQDKIDRRGSAAGPAGPAGRRPGRVHRPDARPEDGALRVPRFAVPAERAGPHDPAPEGIGAPLWFLWGFEALIAAITAAAVPASIAGRPFCEECGYWCDQQPELFTLPAASAAPLVQAVREDNPSRVAELRANPPPYDKSGLVGVCSTPAPAAT